MNADKNTQTIKPALFWYYIAALLFIILSCAGLAKIYFTIIPLFSNSPETRFIGPGVKEITLPFSDQYIIWCYESAFFQGQTYVQKSGLPEGLNITIVEKSSVKKIPLESDTGSTLSFQNEKCFSLASFQAREQETYTISVSGITQSRVFSIRRSLWSLLKGTLEPIFFGIIMLGLGWLSGTGIAIAVYIKRDKALRVKEAVSE